MKYLVLTLVFCAVLAAASGRKRQCSYDPKSCGKRAWVSSRLEIRIYNTSAIRITVCIKHKVGNYTSTLSRFFNEREEVMFHMHAISYNTKPSSLFIIFFFLPIFKTIFVHELH